MLIEKIIFNVLAFSLFIIMFFKMIKKNDANYVIVLCLQALGIAINFIELIFTMQINIFVRILMYIISVILPIVIIILEKRGLNFSELTYIFLAKICMLFNNSKTAKKFLINLITKYPESYVGHKMLAQMYEKEGGMRKAIDEYVQVIDINKQDYQSYYKISFLLHELGKKEEAATMLKNLLSKKPEMLEATQLLGDILCEQELYKEAILVYNDAMKYHPNDFDIYYNLGMVYTMLNDFKNAKDCYEKAATINTLLYTANYDLALINLIYNDLDEAEKMFLKSIQEPDIEPEAYYHLAKICMLKGDNDNAIKFINIAIELDPIIYKVADVEPLFIPIRGYINYPNLDEAQERKTKLNKKEIKAQKHLEETSKLAAKLGNMDIDKNALKKRNKEIEKDQEKEK